MDNPKWTVSIIFQNGESDDPQLFASLREDIELQEKDTPGVIKYFVLRLDETVMKATVFTISDEGKLEEVLSEKPMDNFYKDWTVAKEIWTSFFAHASSWPAAKHFVMTHGHGAGYGFSVSSRQDKYSFGNTPFNLLRIMLSHGSFGSDYSNYFNRDVTKDIKLKFNSEGMHFFEDDSDPDLGIVPVGVFKSALNDAFQKQIITFLYFGNCFMQTIENGFLFQDKVKYLAATEAFYQPTGTDFQTLFQLMASDKNHNEIAQSICEGIAIKTKDPRMTKIYNEEALELTRNGFSFSVNDLTKYLDLKGAISELGQSLIDNVGHVKEPLKRTREDVRICKDVWQDRLLGITDLMRFCKNLALDEVFLRNEVETTVTALEKVYKIFNDTTNPIVVAQYFPFKSFDLTDDGATSVYPEGSSIFFPGNQSQQDRYLQYYLNEFYKKDSFKHPFLECNKWRNFVIYYYDNP